MMGELAALSAAFVWACASLLFVRIGRAGVEPLVLNTFKGVIALGLMGAMIFILYGHLVPPQLNINDALILALSGLIGITIGDTFYFHALAKIGPRRTLLFAALTPPTTALMGYAFLGEPLHFRMLTGMLLTLVGIAWVITEKNDSQSQQLSLADLKIGILFALVAMMCQSTGNILTKYSSTEISALGISIVRMGGALVGLILVMTWKGRWKKTRPAFKSPKLLGTIIIATFLGTFLGIWLLNAGLKYTAQVGTAATLSSMSPIFILPLAFLFEREKITFRSLLGALLAVAGVAFLFYK